MTSEIVLYQPDDTIQLEVRLQDETVWLSQQQMAELFGTDRTSILRHIHNVYKTHELEKLATCAKIAQVRLEGNRQVMRDIHNATKGVQPVNTHKWSTPSHDRWLIIDDSLYHCGHSLKDMGKKLSAITLMGTTPEAILREINYGNTVICEAKDRL